MTTYPQIVSEARRMPVPVRLRLIEEIMHSVRSDLAFAPETQVSSVPKLTRGMLKTEGLPPGDEVVREAYVEYLLEKYQ